MLISRSRHSQQPEGRTCTIFPQHCAQCTSLHCACPFLWIFLLCAFCQSPPPITGTIYNFCFHFFFKNEPKTFFLRGRMHKKGGEAEGNFCLKVNSPFQFFEFQACCILTLITYLLFNILALRPGGFTTTIPVFLFTTLLFLLLARGHDDSVFHCCCANISGTVFVPVRSLLMPVTAPWTSLLPWFFTLSISPAGFFTSPRLLGILICLNTAQCKTRNRSVVDVVRKSSSLKGELMRYFTYLQIVLVLHRKALLTDDCGPVSGSDREKERERN